MVVVAAAVLAGGIAAAASSPTAPSSFVGVEPVRVLDTRAPIGVPATGPIPPGTTINVPVAGLHGIPADATSVAANVAIDSDATAANSFLTVWPTGQPRPITAANNATPGFISPSAGIFQLGTDGQLSVFNSSGNVNVIIDVTGYYVTAAGGPAGPQGPAGPAGPKGDTGATGPAGARRCDRPGRCEARLPRQVRQARQVRQVRPARPARAGQLSTALRPCPWNDKAKSAVRGAGRSTRLHSALHSASHSEGSRAEPSGSPVRPPRRRARFPTGPR